MPNLTNSLDPPIAFFKKQKKQAYCLTHVLYNCERSAFLINPRFLIDPNPTTPFPHYSRNPCGGAQDRKLITNFGARMNEYDARLCTRPVRTLLPAHPATPAALPLP